MVERIWVEVSGRINYPIKAILIEMQENDDFNLEHDDVKFCFSWYSIQVSQVGTKKFVAAWNEHQIQGISTKINARYLCITATKSYKLYHHFF